MKQPKGSAKSRMKDSRMKLKPSGMSDAYQQKGGRSETPTRLKMESISGRSEPFTM
jgi:hypothetical protein